MRYDIFFCTLKHGLEEREEKNERWFLVRLLFFGEHSDDGSANSFFKFFLLSCSWAVSLLSIPLFCFDFCWFSCCCCSIEWTGFCSIVLVFLHNSMIWCLFLFVDACSCSYWPMLSTLYRWCRHWSQVRWVAWSSPFFRVGNVPGSTLLILSGFIFIPESSTISGDPDFSGEALRRVCALVLLSRSCFGLSESIEAFSEVFLGSFSLCGLFHTEDWSSHWVWLKFWGLVFCLGLVVAC